MIINWHNLEIGQTLTVQDMIDLENQGVTDIPGDREGHRQMWSPGVLITLDVLPSSQELLWQIVDMQEVQRGGL